MKILIYLANLTVRPIFTGTHISFIILYVILTSARWRTRLIKYSFRILSAGSILLLGYFILISFWYSTSNAFWDHLEPTVGILSYIFQKGGMVYRSLSSPEILFIPYGPLLFILNGFFIKLLGASIFALKIGGVIAGTSSLLILFFALRNKLGSRLSSICCGYAVLIYLMRDHAFFWNRTEPYLIFFVSLGLLCATRHNKLIAIICSGLTLGAIVDVKITAWSYFIPVYALLYLRFGLLDVVISLIIGICAAISPFLLFKNISLQNYIACLNIYARQGIIADLVRDNIFFAFSLMLFPILFGALLFTTKIDKIKKVYRDNKLYIYALFLGIIISAFSGAKPGSGESHIVPYAPLCTYLFCLFYKHRDNLRSLLKDKSSGVIFAIGLWFIIFILAKPTLQSSVRFFSSFYKNNVRHSDVVNDINRIMLKYPHNSIDMGYGGEDYRLTFYRPLLVFANNPNLIDAPSLMETELVGLPMPEETLGRLAKCRPEIFLIPKGEEPFGISSYYDSKQIFNDAFKNAFLDNYRLKEQTRYYDIWTCKKFSQK